MAKSIELKVKIMPIADLKARIKYLERELCECIETREFYWKELQHYKRPWWMKLLDYLEINYDW